MLPPRDNKTSIVDICKTSIDFFIILNMGEDETKNSPQRLRAYPLPSPPNIPEVDKAKKSMTEKRYQAYVEWAIQNRDLILKGKDKEKRLLFEHFLKGNNLLKGRGYSPGDFVSRRELTFNRSSLKRLNEEIKRMKNTRLEVGREDWEDIIILLGRRRFDPAAKKITAECHDVLWCRDETVRREQPTIRINYEKLLTEIRKHLSWDSDLEMIAIFHSHSELTELSHYDIGSLSFIGEMAPGFVMGVVVPEKGAVRFSPKEGLFSIPFEVISWDEGRQNISAVSVNLVASSSTSGVETP